MATRLWCIPPASKGSVPCTALACLPTAPLRRPFTYRPLGRSEKVSQVCHANARRVARVAKQLEREIGTMLLLDPRLQEAVCPEKRRGADGPPSGMASVTGVELSGDLQVAKVYVSILSDDKGRDAAIDNLVRLQGYVRKGVGASMRLRLVPEIRFILDESIERGMRVLRILETLEKERQGESVRTPPPIAIPEANDDASDAEATEEDEQERQGLDQLFAEFRQRRGARGAGWGSSRRRGPKREEEVVPEKFAAAYSSEDAVLDAEYMAMRQQMGKTRNRGSSRRR